MIILRPKQETRKFEYNYLFTANKMFYLTLKMFTSRSKKHEFSQKDLDEKARIIIFLTHLFSEVFSKEVFINVCFKSLYFVQAHRDSRDLLVYHGLKILVINVQE